MLDVLIVLALLLTISAFVVPMLLGALDHARVARAVGDIEAIEKEIQVYESQTGTLPLTLNDINRGTLLDPWGNPYQYLNFSTVNGKGQMRKDKNLVPLNSTYDLYSMGKDGQSVPPLTAQASRDDIVRAADGGFVGLGSEY